MLKKLIQQKSEQFKHMVPHIKDVEPSVIKYEEQKTATSPYRQLFHVEPDSGVLNDPNGFSYFNGQYHLFYQWTPLAFTKNPNIYQHGWYHLTSKDLVHWKSLGAAIESDTQYDKHGTYSGSALAVGNRLFMMYTGNTWNYDWKRVPYQLGAWMDENNHVSKVASPLVSGDVQGYTGHFRDPKLWRQGDFYYAILGIQRKNLTGACVMYRSRDLSHWQLKGEVRTKLPNFGYMWECPDYFEIDGKGVLLFSPQGIRPDGDQYQNVYQTGYLLGAPLDMQTLKFDHGMFKELDAGFDFYATQTMQSPDGRRILTGWMGVSNLHYPTEKYHYAGTLVFPRELSLNNGMLCQQPVREIAALRSKQQVIDCELNDESKLLQNHCIGEIKGEVNFSGAQQVIMDLRANSENSVQTELIFDYANQKVILDRSHSGEQLNDQNGLKRQQNCQFGKDVKFDILVDQSSIEIFIGDGQLVFSARIFPDKDQTYTFVRSIHGNASIEGLSWMLTEN